MVTTDGLITLPIGKGRTGWLQRSSSFPVSQLLKRMCPLSDQPLGSTTPHSDHSFAHAPASMKKNSLHPLIAKIHKMRGTVIDRDLLGALGEGPWGILFFFHSTKCANAGYSKKSKNLRKPANVGDRRFPWPKGGLPWGVTSFYFDVSYTTTSDVTSCAMTD